MNNCRERVWFLQTQLMQLLKKKDLRPFDSMTLFGFLVIIATHLISGIAFSYRPLAAMLISVLKL